MMNAFELLAVAYFVALGLGSTAAAVPWGRRRAVAALSLAVAAFIAAIAFHGSLALRVWAPHAYLVAGYWVPGLLACRVTVATRFESWLAEVDGHLRPRLPGLPPLLTHVTELAYLLCYPLVPASFLVIWMRGNLADATRFWVAVLVAGYACYVTLPWLLSRPPRLAAGIGPIQPVAALNAFVLGRVSHQLNTFPSGHVAVSLAAAGALWQVSPTVSVIVGGMAVAVAVGAAAGRYHYVTDVWIGAVVAGAALLLAEAVV